MSKDAYLAQLQQLLPPGEAWPRDADATLTQLLAAVAERLDSVHERALDLADELDPRTTLEMLKDWERVAGLPDACMADVADTINERQAILHAKITGRGGQSRQYFIDLAERLGYAITITEYRPFTCEMDCEDPVADEDWWFAWQVNAPETTIRDLTCEDTCEDPLRDWGNEILECAIAEDKPAHTYVIFAYGG